MIFVAVWVSNEIGRNIYCVVFSRKNTSEFNVSFREFC